MAMLLCAFVGCANLGPQSAPSVSADSKPMPANPGPTRQILTPTPASETTPPALAEEGLVQAPPVPAAPAADIEPDPWTALRDRLRPQRCDQARPKHWIKRYAGHPERFQARLSDYAPILHYVALEIEKRQLPAELALVPIVESDYQGYRGRERSPAGMWQLIPSTARSLGLTVQSANDDRLSTVLATAAALTLFEQHLRRFDDDLPLALAAYNAGHGRVLRAMAKSGKARARELPLPRITINYLDKIDALSCLLSDPHSYGFALPPLPPPAQLSTVTLAVTADAQKIAEALRIDANHFRRYNGANRGPKVRRAGHPWLVPAASAQSLLSVAHEQILAKPDAARARTDSAGQVHVVKSGDNLWTLARRYSVSVRELRLWNALGTRSTLQIGQRLKLTP